MAWKKSQVNVKYMVSVFVSTTNFLSPSICISRKFFWASCHHHNSSSSVFIETKIKDLEICGSLFANRWKENWNHWIKNLHKTESLAIEKQKIPVIGTTNRKFASFRLCRNWHCILKSNKTKIKECCTRHRLYQIARLQFTC